jgi:hypothetical protein
MVETQHLQHVPSLDLERILRAMLRERSVDLAAELELLSDIGLIETWQGAERMAAHARAALLRRRLVVRSGDLAPAGRKALGA